jgi:hypothetical protein
MQLKNHHKTKKERITELPDYISDTWNQPSP